MIFKKIINLSMKRLQFVPKLFNIIIVVSTR